MTEISNPYVNLEGYNCFGCAPSNPIGLRLTFREEGDEVLSEWDPQEQYQGYRDVLHGGIQATLMDEIASWTVYIKVKSSGVTSRAELKYRKAVKVSEGKIFLRSKLVGMRRNLADIEVKLLDGEKRICAEGKFTFFTFPHLAPGPSLDPH